MLIFLVDDNKDNRTVAERQLVYLGYKVHSAENGMEALSILAESSDQYDLILMDCQMPVMDGYETTRRIREMERDTDRHIPILALTASSRGDVYKKYEAAGMDDLIFKPMTLESLGQAVEHWIKPRGD